MGRKNRNKPVIKQSKLSEPNFHSPSTWKINENEREYLIKLSSSNKVIIEYSIWAQDLRALKKFVELKYPIPSAQSIFDINLVLDDNAELLRYLIEELDLNFKNLRNDDNTTLLAMAISCGAIKCIKFLLEKQFDPNEISKIGEQAFTPLQIAIMYNQPKIAMLLIDSKAIFDDNTLIILLQSKVTHTLSHDILKKVAGTNFDKVKKAYTQLKKNKLPQELKLEKNDLLDQDTFLKIINNYYKLIILKEQNLLPQIIESGERKINQNFKMIKRENNDEIKQALSEQISQLLNFLTDIYKILIIESNYQEQFENFLVEALEKLNDESFKSEFYELLMNQYYVMGNSEKVIKYGKKFDKILDKTTGNIKAKYQTAQKLMDTFYEIQLMNEAEKYSKKLDNLKLEPDVEKNLLDFWAGNLAKGGVIGKFIQAKVVWKLVDLQDQEQWEEGYTYLQKMYKDHPDYFKCHNYLNLKYYEFLFYYHKDKNSKKAEEMLKHFYTQALSSENILWLENVHTIYEIVICQELNNKNVAKLKSYLKDLHKLPATLNIKTLKKELHFWLKTFKANEAKIEEKTQASITAEKEIKNVEESLELKLNSNEEVISEASQEKK